MPKPDHPPHPHKPPHPKPPSCDPSPSKPPAPPPAPAPGQPLGDIIRNLIYHIWPVKGLGVWQWNIEQLLRRIEQFNGQRIVSVVTDAGTDSFETVKASFKGAVTDFLHFTNDPSLGEMVSFTPLMKRVANIDPRQITFYGHAKGVKYHQGAQPMVRRWTRTMYSNLLDYPKLVDDSLATHPIVGTFKKNGNQFGTLPAHWHYAGTFFWFRNSQIFDKANWAHAPLQWWGTESWPGCAMQIPSDHADCLFTEGTASGLQLYDQGLWQRSIDPAWKAWQQQHAALKAPCSYAELKRAIRATRIIVSGPQRSGTMIAAKMLARDLGLPFLFEDDFGTHDFARFLQLTKERDRFVLQAPSMSAYLHQVPNCAIVWMRRNLQDVMRSQKRIGWEKYEELERDRYFDHSRDPIAVVKTRAWDMFQRISLSEAAWDLDYESLKGHPLWIDREKRRHFSEWQTR